MVYNNEMRMLLKACNCTTSIYDREPVRGDGKVRRITLRERHQLDRVSYPAQGYRRFRAEGISMA